MRRPLLLALVAVPLVFAATSAAQGVIKDFDGLSANLRLGVHVASAGDVDNDGTPDILIGALGNLSNARMYIFSGADYSLLHLESQVGTGLALTGVGVGDVDGDGHDDIAYGMSGHFNQLQNQGRVSVISGKTMTELWRVEGTIAFQALGASVGAAGDFNNDGTPDIVAGSTGGDGRIQVFSGIDGALLYVLIGSQSSQGLGFECAGAGDVNMDGHDDIILSDFGTGNAWVVSGKTSSFLYSLSMQNATFGRDVTGVGDLNGDGRDDFLVSASTYDTPVPNAGAVFVYSGIDGSLMFTLKGGSQDENLGASARSAGDVNNDGVPDIIAGAPYFSILNQVEGIARVYSGANGGLLHTLHGDPDTEKFGNRVAGIGDLNGDGRSEVIVAESMYSKIAPDAGRARLFSPGVCTGTVSVGGAGCAGAGGFVASLSVEGCPTSYEELIVHITDVIGQESAGLLVGVQGANLPIAGDCVLHLDPVGLPILLPVFGSPAPGQGFTKVAGVLPSVPFQLPLKLQALVSDSTKASGMVATNSVNVLVTP